MPSAEPLNIRLKVLAENNVILAKCDGFETEVFMPAIIEGRINIINIIPQRRCNCITTTHLVAKRKLTCNPAASLSETLNNWHVSLSSQISNHNKTKKNTNEPLANSTPAQLKSSAKNTLDKTTSITFPTPEPMRRALAELNTSFVIPTTKINKSLHFNDFPPNERPQTASPPIDSICSEISLIDYESPIGNLSDIARSQAPPSIVRETNSANNTLGISLIPSPNGAQWRKVLSPLRTYARQNHPLNTTGRLLVHDVPNHVLENPTHRPATDKSTKIKTCKLIIDKNVTTSPRTFKRQLLESVPAAAQMEQYKNELQNKLTMFSRKPAFDLLTTPTRKSNCLSKSLFKQFRSRCVNKASSTYPKYKKLCTVPPYLEGTLQVNVHERVIAPVRILNGGYQYHDSSNNNSNSNTVHLQLKMPTTSRSNSLSFGDRFHVAETTCLPAASVTKSQQHDSRKVATTTATTSRCLNKELSKFPLTFGARSKPVTLKTKSDIAHS